MALVIAKPQHTEKEVSEFDKIRAVNPKLTDKQIHQIINRRKELQSG